MLVPSRHAALPVDPDARPGSDIFGALDASGEGPGGERQLSVRGLSQPDLARDRLRLAQQIQDRAVALHRLP